MLLALIRLNIHLQISLSHISPKKSISDCEYVEEKHTKVERMSLIIANNIEVMNHKRLYVWNCRRNFSSFLSISTSDRMRSCLSLFLSRDNELADLLAMMDQFPLDFFPFRSSIWPKFNQKCAINLKKVSLYNKIEHKHISYTNSAS